MRYFFSLFLCFIYANCFGWGSNPPHMTVVDSASGGSTVLFSQLVDDGSAFNASTFYVGQRFYLSDTTGITTLTFEFDFATIGTTCDIRFGPDNDLTDATGTYIVADTFTPSLGLTSVQITTGAISIHSYTVAVNCDGGTLNRSAADENGDLYMRSGTTWDLTSAPTGDLTGRVLKP